MIFGKYQSPIGEILLAADDDVLHGLWFEEQKYFPDCLKKDALSYQKGHPVLELTYKWLDIYFAGQRPDFIPPLAPAPTPNTAGVRKALLSIPFGQTVSYSELAQSVGMAKAVRAASGIVARNPFIVIVPCHRVIGKNGSLTGFAAGIERKKYLLALEALQSS